MHGDQEAAERVGAVALTGVEAWLGNLAEDEEGDGGDRDGEECADDAEQGAADEGGDHDQGAGDVDGLLEHPRLHHVVLELLVEGVEDEGGDARGR